MNLKYLAGLNPKNSNQIVQELFDGSIQIKNLFGQNNSINGFALPLTYGSIFDEELFMQIYQAGYFAAERPKVPKVVHQVEIFQNF